MPIDAVKDGSAQAPSAEGIVVSAARVVYGRAILLGAARGFRRLDAAKSTPSSLHAVGARGTVLDWTLHALASHGVGPITYVGGYQIQKVIERYPNLDYRYHAGWKEDGELATLLAACPGGASSCLVMRSSTLVLPGAVERLGAAGMDVAAGHFSSKDGDAFVGVVGIVGSRVDAALAIAEGLVRQNRRAGLAEWVDALATSGVTITRVALDGLAAPITDRGALARTVFGSKARTLEHIRPLVKSALILDQIRFSPAEWRAGPERIVAAVQESFSDKTVVVRSSAHGEDGVDASLAGRFRSVLDVPASEHGRLRDAIAQVVGSFTTNGRSIHGRDEVFVQPQVSDLAASGVMLTRDPGTGAPYFVLNIDRRSGRSDTVTSGAQASCDTVYVSRRAISSALPEDVGACVAIGRELEGLLHLEALDLEFGIDRASHAYVFQVRPIAAGPRKFELADEDLEEELERVRDFLDAHLRRHPHLHGRTTVFGTMPDWNPAEMIGMSPRPLALSLYQRLIGERAWAEARRRIGYRDVGPEPLIVALGGRPYVDVRASLNSFLPPGLQPKVAERWVDHGLRMLAEDSRLHDKIEFDVAITCLTFDFNAQASRLLVAGLDDAEVVDFRRRLLALTDRVVRGEAAPIDEQLAHVGLLEPRRARTLAGEWNSAPGLARRIHYLIQDCERFGVVPFSVLARYAFMAMAFLRSLRAVGVFSCEDYEAILRSIPTVATDLSRDLGRHAAGELPTDGFLERYGHLRPSSYDITSPSYAAAPTLYLRRWGGAGAGSVRPDPSAAIELFEARAAAIDRLLLESGFTCRATDLRDFVLRSIPAREWAKFEFMKNVDAALGSIARLGEHFGLAEEDLSFLPLERIVRGATDSPTGAVRTQLRREIEFAKKRWNLTCAIRLPHLIKTPADVDVFQLEEWSPNFVSSRRVVAPPILLEGRGPLGDLDGRIVLIRAADPGYDWIFGHALAGLVTQYGGVASHMAIRAAEFGLPAAIGCGELIFERLVGAHLIELDCASRTIRVVQ